MRAIDADALREVLMRELGNRSMQGFGKGLLLANSCIIHAPTIEPDWTEMIVMCDNCGHAIHVQKANAKPTIEPERKKDIIQKFHDYQIDWLKSHYDIELEPQLEKMIVRFLHDTANCYMMEIDREEGEQK